MNSFQLIRTNPRLTTNIKLVITPEYKLYLESFDTNKQLSSQDFKHFPISIDNYYDESLVEFYNGLSSSLAFDVKYDKDNKISQKSYSKQFDDIYWAGARNNEDNWYEEDFEYFAPLYIKKGKLPESFIIFRVDDPIAYEEYGNVHRTARLNKENFFNQIVDKFKCVNVYDMTFKSPFGYFLNRNIDDNDLFPLFPYELNFKKYNFSKWFGIDYNVGVYTNNSKYMNESLFFEQPHFRLEKIITNGFRDNNLIFPNILNLKFLYNDIPCTPETIRDYSINRYYGFYLDKLEFVTNLTSYITPELKPDIKLVNNIFVSGTTPMIVTPFVEEWDERKDYYIYYDNNFYNVVKVIDNNKYVYKVISNTDLSNIDFSKCNDRTCFITYKEGDVPRCAGYVTPSGYTNYISGLTSGFAIDEYLYIEDSASPSVGNAELRDMYADVYIIKINDIYHVLRKRNGQYYVQSDYAINSLPANLEYWKGGKDNRNFYKNIPVESSIRQPLHYPVYRLKFSDIKDFDYDIVNTRFSDFDYEKSTYYVTPEEKLKATEFLDASLNKNFKTHPRNEDGQYKIMNISSEYIAGEELYEVTKENSELSDIWRKNQNVCKWGFIGSNSHSDYTYKLNNSLKVGGQFNRTVNVYSSASNEEYKNLDYFYRIGNFINSGGTYLGYITQTTNVETNLMSEHFSEKFNMEMYVDSEVDYFYYFFKNKMNFTVDEELYIKPTHKYSYFTGGDDYSNSISLFKGINFILKGVTKLVRDEENQITSILTNKNTYNDYKFAIILNDVYDKYTSNDTHDTRSENGLMNNNIIDEDVDGIHIILNEIFKNVLIVINMKISINKDFIDLNNVDVFSEKGGLYSSKTLDGETLLGDVTSILGQYYNPANITAGNFITALKNLNDKTGFDSGITYHYINEDKVYGSTAPMNTEDLNSSMVNMPDWGKDYAPYIINIYDPELLETKINSYDVNPIRGPESNIYDKYSTASYWSEDDKENLTIKDYLARELFKNQTQDTIDRSTYQGSVTTIPYNKIFRYNGYYEPIFKTIPLFNSIDVYHSVSSGGTIVEMKQFEKNYKFDTSLNFFGNINEIIYSKVNPKITPLKLKNSEKDESIYPMVDEFGYQYTSRFLFSSSWDRDFYILTDKDISPLKPIHIDVPIEDDQNTQ